jgi:hypothetical protein
MSSQIIPLKDCTICGNPVEFWLWRLFAFELRVEDSSSGLILREATNGGFEIYDIGRRRSERESNNGASSKQQRGCFMSFSPDSRISKLR